MALSLLFLQFLLRLCFGLAAGMLVPSVRQVSSGYFRNHLYVTLGLAALAALASRYAGGVAFWPAVGVALLSYVGSAAWLYEKPAWGKAALVGVALVGLWGAWVAAEAAPRLSASSSLSPETIQALRAMQVVASGAVLGLTMAAMLLGHWYLNAPGMQLAPLRRLLIAAAAAVVLQALLSGAGLALELSVDRPPLPWWMVALRWAFGLVGVIILIGMAWFTLKIPNTQSATGILYVAVAGAFAGEGASLLLSAESVCPL